MTNAGAEMTTRIFLKEWVVVFGPPKRFLTDRGSNFVSIYFDELAKFLGTKPTQTVAYRPQANGQNERTHRDLHQYLSMFVDQADRRHWDLLLKSAAWAHNSAYHEALKTSPYEVVFGIKPNLSKMWIPTLTHEVDEQQLQEYFGLKKQKLEQIRDAAKQAISRSHEAFLMRQQKKRRAPIFSKGQLVLVKQHRASRWAQKWDGPFEITEVVSENILKIKKTDSRNEDTVHIDYVRPYFCRDGSPATRQSAYFPEEDDERSRNINYEQRLFSDEPTDDILFEVETRASTKVPTQQVLDGTNSNQDVRMTRSRTRMQEQSSSAKPVSHHADDDKSSRQQPTKHKSLLTRARASVQKFLPKQVSFSSSSSSTRRVDKQKPNLYTRGAPATLACDTKNADVSTTTPRTSASSPSSVPALQQFVSTEKHQGFGSPALSSRSVNQKLFSDSQTSRTEHVVLPVPLNRTLNKLTTNVKQHNSNK
jgi:hypothetical protein